MLLIIATIFGAAMAEDWPEFRGPGGQGHSAEEAVPLRWAESFNVAWKTPLPGDGWSSPSLAGSKIWLTASTGYGRSLRVLAVDRESGKLVHDAEIFAQAEPPDVHAKNGYASPTPVIAGDRVFVHFGAAGTAALRTSDATPVWKRVLAYQHGHGPGSSPVLFENLLIVNCDGTDRQYVVALDAATGDVKWRVDRPTNMAYATPLVIDVDGRKQLVSPGAHHAAGYDPRTGRELWRVRYGQGFSNVPRPVTAHGLVFLATGFYGATLLAVRPNGTGDVTGSHVAWSTNRSVPLITSPLIVGDEFYMVSENGIATALDVRTGKQHWQQRLGGEFSASPVFAAGHIFFLSEDGATTVILPGKRFQRVTVNKLDGRFQASMAVSNGSLFLRSERHLYRVSSLAGAE
jgi:outer membrane protein assembly factor BamB